MATNVGMRGHAPGVAVTQNRRFSWRSRSGVLTDLIRQYGWKCGAEIGVLRGETLFALLRDCPALSMIGVDPWVQMNGPRPSNFETGEAARSQKELDACKIEVMSKAEQYVGRVTIMQQQSVEAAAQIENGSLDFVFIDGDHRTAAVLEDIAAWRPKIRIGGGLTGHDLNWPSVKRGVEAMLRDDYVELADHVWFSVVK